MQNPLATLNVNEVCGFCSLVFIIAKYKDEKSRYVHH